MAFGVSQLFKAASSGLKAANLGQGMVTGIGAKELMKLAGKHPARAGAVAWGGGRFGKDFIYDPLRMGATGGQRAEFQIETEREVRKQYLNQQVQMEHLKKAMLSSLSRLAALDPQLYNEVTAGMRLPQGAVVFGGQKRTDLLEELALTMAQGGFQKGPAPEDELLSLLGA